MIVRSVQVQGFGYFVDRVEAGPFTPGLNILFGPNGAGKSTFQVRLRRACSMGIG